MWDVNNMFTHDGSGGLVQAITADAASTNIIDLDVEGLNIAAGKKGIYLVVVVIEEFNNLGSLELLVQTDTNDNFATNLKEIWKREFALADLTVGQLLFNQRLPVEIYQRYIRLFFKVVGSNPDTGKVQGGFTDGPESAQAQLDQVTL